MNNKVCFVILHYGDNKSITLNTIKSIKNLKFDGKIDVIVVCNGSKYDISNDLTGEIISLVLEENAGFSKGNNYGYRYAREHDNYDFIIVLNNDVVVEQNDFIFKLYELYQKTDFYVAGPDIYVPYRDYHSSPLRDNVLTADEVIKIINHRKEEEREYSKWFSRKCVKSYLLETSPMRNSFRFITKIRRKIKNDNQKYEYQQENVVLSGACLIFSSNFITLNEKAFVPEVFLYYEEDYLTKRCLDNRWKIVYSNELVVIHYHRGSSGLIGASYRTFCDNKIKMGKTFIHSSEEYLSFLNNMNEI